jgi:hypothetical protein
LGWKIDYNKLFKYLKKRYGASKVYYYGGVRTFGFSYSVLSEKPLALAELIRYLKKKQKTADDVDAILIERAK